MSVVSPGVSSGKTPAVIAPGGTIGIFGGGQLGRMIAMSARGLGYGVVVLDPDASSPAAGLADRVIHASFEDTEAARRLADACDVVTYEFENVPEATVRAIEGRVPVRPDATLLGVTQDRVREHAFLHDQGVPTAPGCPVRTPDQLAAAVLRFGFPSRLKSARGGYDGGGQHRIRTAAEAHAAESLLDGREWLFERDVAFTAEVSVVVTRGVDGAVRTFPVFENEHADGILRLTRAPARVPAEATAEAEAIARTLAEAAGLVGTLTVECFVTAAGVLVNELAPRVHNSGHLTVEACATSQFEQHVRAICGLPLGDTALRAPAAMVNLLGMVDRRRARLTGADVALAVPDVHLHLYGKASVRPRRKMGHVTALGATIEEAVARAERAAGALGFG
ncbi:MAG: 5-(carboxyamino)imidazole ribonucleotide synthase [Pseudomonadota bacterium]|nr:5-(carboxyamino)imidazole ribonucleotide synthase [Pseudomonadota bacterium]